MTLFQDLIFHHLIIDTFEPQMFEMLQSGPKVFYLYKDLES